MAVTMQKTIKITGDPVGRSLRKRYREASHPAWEETGQQFHLQMRPKRFTETHAKEAKYKRRAAKYTNRKQRKFGHRNPLEYTGTTKALVRTARIKARGGTGQHGSRGGVQVIYRGGRQFNRKNPHSDIDMVDEFTRLTEREALLLGIAWETRFQARFR